LSLPHASTPVLTGATSERPAGSDSDGLGAQHPDVASSGGAPHDPQHDRRRRRQGLLCFVGALAAFASYDAFCKHMVAQFPAPFMNFTRYIVIASFACLWCWQQGDRRPWRTAERGALVLRGVMLAIVATCFMTALIWMPLAEATAIYFTSPLLMVALAPWVVGERVRLAQWLAVAAGFVGMLFIVRPGSDLPWLGTVLMVVAAVCYAVFQLLTRRLAMRVPPATQYWWTAMACLLLAGLPGLATLPDPLPSAGTWALLLGAGLVSGGAQLLVLAAYRRVAAATLAPMNYLQLLMSVVLSTLVFDRAPDALALGGIALIAIAGVGLARLGPPSRGPTASTRPAASQA